MKISLMALFLVFLLCHSSYSGIDFGLGDKAVVVPEINSKYEATLYGQENRGNKQVLDAVLRKISDLTREYDSYPAKHERRKELTDQIGYYAKVVAVLKRYGSTIRAGSYPVK